MHHFFYSFIPNCNKYGLPIKVPPYFSFLSLWHTHPRTARARTQTRSFFICYIYNHPWYNSSGIDGKINHATESPKPVDGPPLPSFPSPLSPLHPRFSAVSIPWAVGTQTSRSPWDIFVSLLKPLLPAAWADTLTRMIESSGAFGHLIDVNHHYEVARTSTKNETNGKRGNTHTQTLTHTLYVRHRWMLTVGWVRTLTADRLVSISIVVWRGKAHGGGCVQAWTSWHQGCDRDISTDDSISKGVTDTALILPSLALLLHLLTLLLQRGFSALRGSYDKHSATTPTNRLCSVWRNRWTHRFTDNAISKLNLLDAFAIKPKQGSNSIHFSVPTLWPRKEKQPSSQL